MPPPSRENAPQVEKKTPNMEKIAKKSPNKKCNFQGGGHWRPQGTMGTRKRGIGNRKWGGAYIAPAGGGARLCAPLEKNSAIYWVFLLLFSMWGPFCYVFLLIGVARALTPVQVFVGGVGKPKKDHHKNIKSPPPPPPQ